MLILFVVAPPFIVAVLFDEAAGMQNNKNSKSHLLMSIGKIVQCNTNSCLVVTRIVSDSFPI